MIGSLEPSEELLPPDMPYKLGDIFMATETAMADTKRSFPLTVHIYLWVALLMWCSFPLWVAAYQNRYCAIEAWSISQSLAASIAIVVALLYVGSKCGDDRLSFMEGMLYITCFMQTGWTYMTLIVVMAAIPVVLIASFGIVVYCLISGGDAQRCQILFHRLVGFFYRNRMVQ